MLMIEFGLPGLIGGFNEVYLPAIDIYYFILKDCLIYVIFFFLELLCFGMSKINSLYKVIMYNVS